MKSTLNDLKSLFTSGKKIGSTRISKHQASKKGYKHIHNLSYGQRKSEALNK